MTLVTPEHRPTLSEQLGPLPAPARWGVLGALALLVVAVVVALTGGSDAAEGRVIVRERPLAFNLRLPPSMREVEPGAGEWLRIERAGRDSLAVEPLQLPAYGGEVGGVLPVVAAREADALRRRFPGFELVEEGKARINDVAGYSLVFRVSRVPRRYGRLVLLPQPVPGARDGVKLLLLANPSAGAGKAGDVGVRGLLKTPYRSFRFGTEAP